MKTTLPQLPMLLKNGLQPLYLLTGNEPLLAQEACDQILAAAKAQGFAEVHRFEVDNTFDLTLLQAEQSNLSLFDDRKVMVLNCANTPATKLIDHLKTLAHSQETVIIVKCPKLTPAQSKSKWYQALDAFACHLPIWPIDTQRWPQWLTQRARQHGVQLSPEALQLLAHHTEGNLLAAQQYCQRLALAGLPSPIQADDLHAYLFDQSQFDVFQLTDAWLSGDATRCHHILPRLLEDGTEPTIIVWALSKEMRLLATLHEQSKSKPLAQCYKQHGIWPKRQPLIEKGLRRFPYETCLTKLQMCAQADRTIKGLEPGDTTQILTQILLPK